MCRNGIVPRVAVDLGCRLLQSAKPSRRGFVFRNASALAKVPITSVRRGRRWQTLIECEDDQMPEWINVAGRVADAFEIDAGGLVVVRDRCGRSEIVDEVVIAFERRGVTALIDPASDLVLERILRATDPALLSTWSTHRAAVLESADGIVSLGAGPLPEAPQAALDQIRVARAIMEEVESRRTLPFLAVAVPTIRLAALLGRELDALDLAVRAASAVPLHEIRRMIQTALVRAAGDPLTMRTADCELRLRRGGRKWLADDGHISAADRAAGAVVSNLPCGSIYTTVLEDSAEGTVRLPELAGARDVVLSFTAGRVVGAEGTGAQAVLPWLATFDAGAACISHIGLALNPACPGDTGWTILDEHRAGAVFLALGENRYMGGANASILNHDIALPHATLLAGNVPLTIDGQLV